MKNKVRLQNFQNWLFEFDFEIQFFPNLEEYFPYQKYEILIHFANNLSKNIQFQVRDDAFC